jgi:hypothetical protein
MFRRIPFYFRLLIHGLRAFRLVILTGNRVLDKVTGINTEDAVALWLSVFNPNGYSIVMTDINFSEKSIDFWAGMPKHITRKFIFSDILILSVKDLRGAETVMDSIHPGFAKATLFSGCKASYNNFDKESA